MKKIIYLLYLIIGILGQSVAQTTSSKETDYAFHAETDLASYHLAFSHKIGKRVWLGLGVGGGLSLIHGNFEAPFKKDWTKEQYTFRTFISNAPQKKLNYEIGVLMGQMYYDKKNADKEFAGQRFASGYLRLFYGSEKFKIGSQLSLGQLGEATTTLWMWTPIIVRCTITGRTKV